MILQIVKVLFVMLSTDKQKPVHDLRRREPINLQLNWTFILLTLAMVLFFVTIFVFGIGNEYPNDLMAGELNI